MLKPIYCYEYAGQTLSVYDDRVEIERKANLLTALFGTGGTKTFYYEDISAIEFKPISIELGALKITVPSNCDTFIFGDYIISKHDKQRLNAEYEAVYLFIKNKIKEFQNREYSGSVSGDAFEKMKKFKELLDTGIITQEEFDIKKKKILAL